MAVFCLGPNMSDTGLEMFPEEVILLLSHGNTGSSGVAATLVSPPAGATTDPLSQICMRNEISAVSAKTGSSQYVAYNSVAKLVQLTVTLTSRPPDDLQRLLKK